MREFINFCSKSGEKQFVAVTKFGATWTENENKFKVTFNKGSLTVGFLIINSFSFGNLPFRQITGIPMGSDPGESIFILL